MRPAARRCLETAAIPDASEMDQCRILVVDDNPIGQKLTLTMLNHIGYTANAANNGLEAVNAHSAQAYDIILMDCRMPVMDGLEATRRIRALEGETHTGPCQIIAVTGDTGSDDHDRCLDAGMDWILCKPYRMDELRTVIAQAMASCGRQVGKAG